MGDFLNKVKQVRDFSGCVSYGNKDEAITYASGDRRREEHLPNNVQTSFSIASGTKGFTALLILTLVDEGRLSLDEFVFDRLSHPFPNMDHSIRVKHLLTHTSGIYDYFNEELLDDFSTMFEKLPIQKIHGPSDMYPLLIEGKAYFSPGDKFKYCNSAFVILAMLVEEITGKAYGDYLNEVVIEPLGLKGTGCFQTHRLPENVAIGYEKDHNGWYANIFELPMICTGDGGLYTNVEDMTKLWLALLDGRLISRGLLEEALKVQVVIEGTWCYGLGFYSLLDEQGQEVFYALIGEEPGVSFLSRYYVEDKKVLTIMSNTSSGAWDMSDALE